MKVAIILTILGCFAVPSILGANFWGYYPSWAQFRQGDGNFNIDNIDPSLNTHLVYSFAVLNGDTLLIEPADVITDIQNGGYDRFIALKQRNPRLKTLLAIGGWEDSNIDDKYSRLVSSQDNIDRFVQSVLRLFDAHNFDGLDMDWEYPKSEADKTGFTNLMNALHRAFGGRLILSAAIPASPTTLAQGFDIGALNRAVDFVNLMAYDIHGAWENEADHHAPLYSRSADDNNNADTSVEYLLQQGLEAGKINLGIPTYGRTWTLSSAVTAPPAPASGAGTAGPITGEEGMLAYYEVCRSLQSGNGWTNVQDPSLKTGPYAYSRSEPIQWVSYDDVEIVRIKSSYVLAKQLGGAMVWDISMDDFKNVCGAGANPILSTIHNIVTA